jgi:hypothetical protein
VVFSSTQIRGSTMEKVSAPKKDCVGFPKFHNPMVPIPSLCPCPSRPGARKPISVAIPSDRLRKRKVNVSHGKTKMDKMVRRRGLPCIRHSRSLHREKVVCGAVPISVERKR